MTAETTTRPDQKAIEWQEMLQVALEAPGSVGNEYSRFHNYSFLNQMLLLSQGCPIEPIATFNRWKELDRHVVKGAKAFEIVRPITVTAKDQLDEQGQPKRFTKFKRVKAIFPVSMTAGEDLPPAEVPDWDAERALGALAITRVPFALFDGNVAGYSTDRQVAINPAAVHPTKTLLHEVAHIVGGHTAPDRIGEYQKHRGRFELEAEAPAYLVSKELQIATPEEDTSSRGYIQHWMRGQRPTDESIRTIFKSTQAILSAGRLAVEAAEA